MGGFPIFLHSLIEWQNILFTTTLGLGALLFAFQAFGLLGDHDSDGDAHADAAVVDGDADAHVDAHADADGDGHPDADADAHADADADGHGSGAMVPAQPAGGMLRSLGLGRVPIALLLPLALSAFGFLGLTLNALLGGMSGSFARNLIWASLGGALAGSGIVMRLTSGLFGKFFDDGSKSASSKRDLLGLVGTVKSGSVDHEYGLIKVRDAFGNDLEVPAVMHDTGPGAKYGEEVVLVDWDQVKNRFKVVRFDDAPSEGEGRRTEARRRAIQVRQRAR